MEQVTKQAVVNATTTDKFNTKLITVSFQLSDGLSYGNIFFDYQTCYMDKNSLLKILNEGCQIIETGFLLEF